MPSDLLLTIAIIIGVGICIAAAVGYVQSGSRQPTPSAERLRIIERKVDMILDELNIEFTDSPELNEVNQLLAAGDKLGAIKRYREITNSTLVDAKAVVDSMM